MKTQTSSRPKQLSKSEKRFRKRRKHAHEMGEIQEPMVEATLNWAAKKILLREMFAERFKTRETDADSEN